MKLSKVEAEGSQISTDSDNLIVQLRDAIAQYLSKRPHLSVNAISKKTGVSEPTLRRIMGLRIKTAPQVTTVLDILTYISGTTSVREIIKLYPGPLAQYLSASMPYLEDFDQNYSNQINEELKNPIKYLIYKLALNHGGVKEEKIIQLYGNHGFQLLSEMIDAGYIERDDKRVCRTISKSFTSSEDDFVRNFKLVADFIKPHKNRPRNPLNPLYVNCSDSVSAEAYEEICKLQKKTLKKIREILSQDSSKGELPFFLLCAIDTMDLKAAYELENS